MKPTILITNDDGVNAPGIRVLIRLMKQIGNVIVVAPDGPRSGQSNAITVHTPVRYRLLESSDGLTIYSCNGTPTDCVKLAFNDIIDQNPDLVVAGINHGSNSAINVIYSGTMGAVLEGCQHGVASIGFSLCDHAHEADFTTFEPYILQIARETLKNGLPENICLNVNAPVGEIRGTRITRQCNGLWVKEFARRTDPVGHDYYWLTGNFENHEPDAEDTDEWALANGYVSVVPTTTDMTAHRMIERIKSWKL